MYIGTLYTLTINQGGYVRSFPMVKVVFILFIIGFISSVAHAQDYPALPGVMNNTGLQPYGTYDGVQENISIAGGDLNIYIPLLKLPGRDGLDFTLGLTYDSNLWSLHDTFVAQANQNNLNWQTDPNLSPGLWRLAVPTLTDQYSFEGYAGSAGSLSPLYCVTNFVLVTPDGSKHAFANLRDCNFYNNTGINNVDISESGDGSFIRLDVTNPADIVAI